MRTPTDGMSGTSGLAAALVTVLALSTLVACGGQETSTEGGTAVSALPGGVVLERAVGSAPGEPLAMAATPAADYRDGEREAWRLEGLFGSGFRQPEAKLEVHRAQGEHEVLEAPFEKEGGLVLALTVNKKEEPVVAWIDPEDPFPEYHGRGGNRERPGDPNPRWREVTRLVLRVPGPTGEATQGDISKAMLKLTWTVDGEDTTWTEEDLAAVEPMTVQGDMGEAVRDAFSLRDLVKQVAGDGARATGLKGEGGREITLEAGMWDDASRTPVLRLNRRGNFKFHWMDADKKPIPGGELRNITQVLVQSD